MTAMIYAPFPDRESARKIAAALIDEKLIACANILGEVESLFSWEGELDSAVEVGVLFKTDKTILARATKRLGELHPYDTPAVLGWDCDFAAPATMKWLAGLQA